MVHAPLLVDLNWSNKHLTPRIYIGICRIPGKTESIVFGQSLFTVLFAVECQEPCPYLVNYAGEQQNRNSRITGMRLDK